MKHGFVSPELEIILLNLRDVVALSDAGEQVDPEFELEDD